ncbi:UPF0149 family protein [Pseudomonas sp.]|uniref:UPF0149 family protein n=1 Tax=Pseudomonas sp. TaxID=306 RepID=UPI003D0D2169
MWDAYEEWRAADPSRRPEISLVDGFLAGAAVSLRQVSDDEWLEAAIGAENLGSDRVVAELKGRLETIRAELAGQAPRYVPVLEVNSEGDFDLSAWATGFLETVGPDLEIWAYVLAGKPEGGLLGLLGTHAAGPTGDAVIAAAVRHPNSTQLQAARSTAWEYIPDLLASLYRQRSDLAATPQ